MSTKDKIMVVLIIVSTVIFFGGIIWLLSWDFERDKKEVVKNCQNIAKVAELTEWHSDGYKCYVVKDKKIVEVKL